MSTSSQNDKQSFPMSMPWFHICVDMQRMFCEDTPWHVPWMQKIVPRLESVMSRQPENTVFTRFLTPRHSDAGKGAWRDYYQKWSAMTADRLPKEMFELVPELARFAPPARIFDKMVYSPWHDGRLHQFLAGRQIRKLIVSGGETDVCVMATVLGAIDYGYEVSVLSDAVCSSADDTHDAGLKLLSSRFSVQVEMISVDELLHQYG